MKENWPVAVLNFPIIYALSCTEFMLIFQWAFEWGFSTLQQSQFIIRERYSLAFSLVPFRFYFFFSEYSNSQVKTAIFHLHESKSCLYIYTYI